MELIALGKTIVTYADPWVLDTLYHCDAIVKVSYGKPHELTNAALQLLQSPRELKALSYRAKGYVTEYHQPCKVAQYLVKTYVSILNEK